MDLGKISLKSCDEIKKKKKRSRSFADSTAATKDKEEKEKEGDDHHHLAKPHPHPEDKEEVSESDFYYKFKVDLLALQMFLTSANVEDITNNTTTATMSGKKGNLQFIQKFDVHAALDLCCVQSWVLSAIK